MRRFLLLLAVLPPYFLHAGNKIKYYFNHPVDNSVSIGVNATYLSGTLDDTLIAYINRAKYTLDVAVYNTTTSATNVMNAVNSAYARGVKVRWIYDGGYQTVSDLSVLNSGIHKLGSPTSSAYTIMHNKFMVVDANSSNPDDALVWTGSSNWNSPQFGTDYNNIVVVQDSAIARAYRAQFNMMWGDTGIAPNNSLSKFGQFKTDLGHHDFYVEGKHIEVYFSPADGTNSHIQAAISSADVDMYFGMYTFTDNTNASMLVSKKNSGVYVAGIQDQSSVSSSSASTTLSSGLGSNYKIYNSSNLYHNKYLVVDPSDRCSDPMVVTGSHNWSFSANTKNDENTLIIHNDTAANIYYQAFRGDFIGLGGSLAIKNGCTNAVGQLTGEESNVQIFPNPSTGIVTISFDQLCAGPVRIDFLNVMGQTVGAVDQAMTAGQHTISHSLNTPGMYLVKLKIGENIFTRRILVTGSNTH